MGRTFNKVTHVIFDMDGLLLDTEKLYTRSAQMILDEYGNGQTYTYEVKSQMMGLQTQDMSQRMVEIFKLPMTWQEYAEKHRQINLTLMTNAELMPGARRLLCHLHEHKVPFCLATSSGMEMVGIKTTNHRELFKLFNHWVCGSTDPEVKEGKPAPDIFLVAATRFADKPHPSQCLVFEDSPNGIQAACSAGMQSVMVPDAQTPAEMRTKATLVLNSLEDFKPEEFGLPPFPEVCSTRIVCN